MAGSAASQPTRVVIQDRASRKVFWRQLGGLFAITIGLVAIPITHALVQAESSQAPPGVGRVAAGRIGTGAQHTCVIQASGEVRCWGRNNRGQLGAGNTATIGLRQTPGSLPAVRLGGRKALSLALGANHSCALLEDQTVRCWGRNDSGQLGIGNNADLGDNELPDTSPPAIVGEAALAITAGAYHTCAILVGGVVKCWGNNDAGQLGVQWSGNIGDDEAPQQAPAVALGRPAVAVSAGGSHTCAILDNGAVRCWGVNNYGQIGSGIPTLPGDQTTTTTSGSGSTPGCIPQLDDCSAPSDKTKDGTPTTTAATGLTGGQLSAPLSLGTGRKAVAISAGNASTCALLDDATLRCWGANRAGELGLGIGGAIGDDETPAAAPVLNFNGLGVKSIASGYANTCAILSDDTLRCFGAGDTGQLGLGNTTTIGDNEALMSVPPIGLGATRKAVAVSTAGYRSDSPVPGLFTAHTCALLADDTVVCWGSNGNGELGYPNGPTLLGDDELLSTVPAVDLGDLPVATTTTTSSTTTSTTAVPTSAAGRFTAEAPTRVLDTRLGLGITGGPAKIGAGQTIDLVLAPPLTDAVALNVTAVNASGATWLTVWPTGGPIPATSNLNVDAGVTVPNFVVTKVSATGHISIRNANGAVDVVVDRMGSFSSAGGRLHAVDAKRVVDTRTGIGVPVGTVGANQTVTSKLDVAGSVVPVGATAVVLNVTAIAPTSPGWVTIWPAGQPLPPTSNLNFVGGQTVANLVITKLGADGSISLRNQAGSVNLAVDVLGWFDDGAGAASAGQLTALQPSRLLDTRSAAPDATWSKSTEPGVGGPFNVLRLKIVGRGGVPATAGAVILNVTAISPSSAGYLTVGAAVALPPSTSNLNFAANQTVSNLVVANIAADGTVSIVGPGPFTDTAVDVQGYFSS